MPRLRPCLTLLSLLPSFALAAPACQPGQAIDESGFLNIGGIEQWVTIQGDNCANPVLLVAHGGPANPYTPFGGGPYAAWRKDYTVVHWDQRGGGMTYGRNRPAEDEPLTVEQIRDDGLELARHIRQRFNKRKLILMGSSWGSIVGANMARKDPEQFCAWVGVAQVVGGRQNRGNWNTVLERARAADDKATVAQLEALGPPPWTNPRNFGILRRATRKYELQVTEPTVASWWKVLPAYATPQAKADYDAGEDYSFINFVGWKGDGMLSKVDMYKLGTRFALPVYIVQGTEDLLTEAKVTRPYYEAISAPDKAYIEVPRAGHDPNGPLIEAQKRVLDERVRSKCS
ncbi:alpha/beta fold hydrolase [Massilia sp. AB1]|uniref:alpha/beta fold hydrolase n=1 Tax=Massilia sp. AB1 TaxID=2823371 RepID=UPI001B834FE4|nr:alpha/beta hydrolase [Massilia sp. AB1]